MMKNVDSKDIDYAEIDRIVAKYLGPTPNLEAQTTDSIVTASSQSQDSEAAKSQDAILDEPTVREDLKSPDCPYTLLDGSSKVETVASPGEAVASPEETVASPATATTVATATAPDLTAEIATIKGSIDEKSDD